jgi:ribosomal protein L12E/L44/L45/RPP1/RPP2
MAIGANACPAELRRAAASPYRVIQKYSKSYYATKQYWCKVYEVEYPLIHNPRATHLLAAARPGTPSPSPWLGFVSAQEGAECGDVKPEKEEEEEEERAVEGSVRRSFVAATGDEIGMYGEGSSSEEAVRALQARLSDRILAMLEAEKPRSHCLPSKRKQQDVLLRDFEAEMASHRVRFVAAPRYAPVPVAFGMPVRHSQDPEAPAQEAAEAEAEDDDDDEEEEEEDEEDEDEAEAEEKVVAVVAEPNSEPDVAITEPGPEPGGNITTVDLPTTEPDLAATAEPDARNAEPDSGHSDPTTNPVSVSP